MSSKTYSFSSNNEFLPRTKFLILRTENLVTDCQFEVNNFSSKLFNMLNIKDILYFWSTCHLVTYHDAIFLRETTLSISFMVYRECRKNNLLDSSKQ